MTQIIRWTRPFVFVLLALALAAPAAVVTADEAPVPTQTDVVETPAVAPADVLDLDPLADALKMCNATCEANCEDSYQECLATNPKCDLGPLYCNCGFARQICMNLCCS